MNAKTILINAKTRISARDKWTQFRAARTAEGWVTSILSPDACKFCLTGAIEKARSSIGLDENSVPELAARRLLRNSARRMLGTSSIVNVNDEHGFVAVHAILDDAIQNAN